MTRIYIALIAALVALTGGGVWYVMDLQADKVAAAAVIAAQTRTIAAHDAQAAQARLAREVDAARALRQREADRATAAAVEQILFAELGECADAPIDPDLADILNGLRPARD
jgi:hypothetical protein